MEKHVTHAHNDWLQASVEWGLAGWAMVICLLGYLERLIKNLVFHPTAPATVLVGRLLLFAGHAYFDLLIFIPQLTLLAVITSWLHILEDSSGSADSIPAPAPAPF